MRGPAPPPDWSGGPGAVRHQRVAPERQGRIRATDHLILRIDNGGSPGRQGHGAPTGAGRGGGHARRGSRRRVCRGRSDVGLGGGPRSRTDGGRNGNTCQARRERELVDCHVNFPLSSRASTCYGASSLNRQSGYTSDNEPNHAAFRITGVSRGGSVPPFAATEACPTGIFVSA